MNTRRAVHDLVDKLEEAELELARQAIQEIRGDGFTLTVAEERELKRREAECDQGDRLSAKEFLEALRSKR